ncbi:MAG: hypothetical protein ACI4EQ_05490 [Lachnospiraceae bacterium]
MAKDKRIIEGQLNLFDFFKEETEGTTAKAGKFAECKDCWCRDCRHNAINEGIERDICGVMQACPACDMCVNAGVAEICVIGSAKEGCSVRAFEERGTDTE